MLYQPPTGGAANDPYVGANPGLGIQGSRVPPKAVEHHQRELVALITATGQTPAEADLMQVAKGVQSGRMNYVVATGTANAWVVAPALALAAYAAGLPLRVLATATNTSTTVNVNVSGLGNRRIKKQDGSDPAVGDLVAGLLYPMIDDGTSVRIAAPLPSDSRNVLRSQLSADRGGSGQLTGDSIITRVTGYGSVVSSFQGGSTFSAGVLTIGSADAGLWSLSGHARQAFTSNSGLAVYVYKNSTQAVSDGGPSAASGSISHGSASRIIQLAAGDTVDMRVVQTTGADFTFNDLYSFSAVRLGA